MKKSKKKKKRDRDEEDKIIHVSENVDKKGMFYTIKRLPEKLEKKMDWAYDRKNDDWMLEESDLKRAKKIIKKRGYKMKIARMNQVVMKLADALEEIGDKPIPRLRTKIKSLDDLVGGGFVKGATVLVSGPPGAGKSTLATQLMLRWSKKRRCVYINTEENVRQVTDRFQRINENEPFNKKQKKNLIIVVQKDVNLVRNALKKEDASVIILDSIGGFVESSSSASRGGTRILRDAAGIIHDYVKQNNPEAVAIMVGHVNKKGDIAGPKSIQHMGDTVLFIDGSSQVRTIQPLKNRYGDTSGMLSVNMTETGLEFEDSQQMEREIRPGARNQVARLDQGWDRME